MNFILCAILSNGEPGHLSCSTKKYFIPAWSLCLKYRFEINDTVPDFSKYLICFF